jgi:hypothetical protein
MANSIGEVLKIEPPDSYIKRPTGPMITVEIRDVSKLAGIIKIPSMVEGASPEDTMAQRILYSGLSNQCKKCRRFGHLANTCPLNRPPAQGGNTPPKNPPIWNGKTAPMRSAETQPTTTKQGGSRARNSNPQQRETST